MRKAVSGVMLMLFIIGMVEFTYVVQPVRGVEIGDGDLVLWLPLDGDLKDYSGNGYDAQSFCTPLIFKEGIRGEALYLDGIDDYISVPDAPEFSIVNNPKGMTISLWIAPATLSYPTANEYGYIRFLGKGRPNEHEWVFVIYNNNSERPNRISFYIHNATGGYGIGAYVQEPITVNEWIFIAGVINEGVLYIYKNGVLKGKSYNYTQPNPIGIIVPKDGNAPVCIGTRGDVQEYFMGRIDDFRIYKRALTENEISALYNDNIPPEIGKPIQNPDPDNVQPFQNVTVQVNVTDYGTGIHHVTLWYSIDNGTSWTPVGMTALLISCNSTVTYEAHTPGYENCTWVTYKIVAYDNAGNKATKDNNGYGYKYHVIPEFPSCIIMSLLMLLSSIAIVSLKENQ